MAGVALACVRTPQFSDPGLATGAAFGHTEKREVGKDRRSGY